MQWSWRVGSIAGIALYLHATFLLLLARVAIGEYQSTREVPAALSGVVFVLAMVQAALRGTKAEFVPI